MTDSHASLERQLQVLEKRIARLRVSREQAEIDAPIH